MAEIDSQFVEHLFPDGVDAYFSDETGFSRTDPFGGWESIQDDFIGLAFPMGGGTTPM